MWDATCPDTYALSYSPNATSEAGAVATQAEERKEAKYAHLNPMHSFSPVAIETSGVFGPKTMQFVRELGQRLECVTGEARSTNFCFRESRWQFSVVIQHQCWAPWTILPPLIFFIVNYIS